MKQVGKIVEVPHSFYMADGDNMERHVVQIRTPLGGGSDAKWQEWQVSALPLPPDLVQALAGAEPENVYVAPSHEWPCEICDEISLLLTLPEWARAHPEVVEKCRSDYAYRCDVMRAETDAWRRVLLRQAGVRVEMRQLNTRIPRALYERVRERTGGEYGALQAFVEHALECALGEELTCPHCYSVLEEQEEGLWKCPGCWTGE